MKIEFTGTQTNVGSDDNEYSAIVEDADGNDVTVNYQISTYCGKLVVTARPITVRSADASKDYDGDPLTCPDWSVVSITQIVEGHTLDVAVSGTRTEIGESENSIAEIKVTDANGEDVTRNYDFSEKQHGILTVKDTKTPDGKRPIVITAASSEHIYDGTTYTDPNYTVTEPGVNVGLAQGHTIEVVVQGEITNAGEADNLVTAVIIRDATSTIVYDSLNPANDAGIYEVTLKKGTLTVTPRQVFVVLGDATKLYDGTVTLPAPYDTSYTIYESPNPLTGLLTGHNLTATVVGSTANVNTNAVAIAAGDVWQTMLLKESISIIGPSGDMTENYEIVETYGKLTIQPRVLALTVPDVTKIYDGMSLVKDAYASLDEVQPTDGGLLPGHVLYAAVEGDRVDIGEGVAFVSPDNLRVEFEGVDLGGNYTYTETTGTVTILQRPITIKANDTIKVYDDKYDIPGGFTLSETLDDQGLVPGHVAEATVIGSEKICSTGGYTRVVESSVQILNGKTNVTANYKITYATGSLTITPRPVVITGGSAEKEYDGTPLVKNSVEWDPEVENAGLLLNHTITEWTVTGSCTEVGQEPNVVTPDSITIVDAYGNEVQGNYTFSYANGTLTVTDPTTPPPGGKVIVARVNTDYSGLVFLRQNSGGTYTGGGFSAATAYTGLIDDTFAMTYLTGLALGDASQTLYEMQIEVLRPDLAGYLMPGSPAVGVYYAETNDTMNTGDSSQAYTQGYYLLPVTDASALMELVSSLTLPTAYAADEAAYREFVYTNGQYTYVPQSTALAMQAFMEAKDLHADDPDIVSKVAQCIRAALSYNLEYDTALDGERDIAAAVVSGAYTEGVCRHYAVAATMLYRTLGIPARYTVGFAARVNAGEETYVTTDTAHAWVEIYIDGIGWVALDVTGGTTLPNPPDEEEEDPPQNAIEIRPTTLYMKYVDGTTVLKPQDMLTYGIGTLLEGNNNFNALLNKGYTYTVRYSGEQRTVGYGNSYIEEFHLFDPEGNEVTTTFVVTARAGRLHIYYEELTITSRPGGKEYDGTPLDPPMRDTGNGYFITGQFVTSIDGQAVIHQEVIELNASITNIGSMANYFTPKIIDATTGEDVTYMYKITCKYGLLTVKGREITVIAGSDAKTYDGEPLTCPTFTVEGILHKNHEIEVVTEGSVLLGRGVNTVKSVLIYDINDPLKTPLNDVYYQINTKPGTLRVTR